MRLELRPESSGHSRAQAETPFTVHSGDGIQLSKAGPVALGSADEARH